MHDTLPRPEARWALFLDVDGTLLDIASDPASVVVPPTLLTTLLCLRDLLGGALALVSGRAIDALDQLFAPLALASAGQHGAEIRLTPYGDIERLVDPAPILAMQKLIDERIGTWSGVLIERKGLSIAIHYRHAMERGLVLRQFLSDLLQQHKSGLTLLEGRLVFDLKPEAVTKGTAIERFMRTRVFSGRIPVFVGDDKTDEHGFATVNSAGGHSLRVGPLEGSLATSQIAEPAAVRAWLDHAVDVIAADGRSDPSPSGVR